MSMTATEQTKARATLAELRTHWEGRSMLGGFGGYDRGAAFLTATVEIMRALDREWPSLDRADEAWLTNEVNDMLDRYTP